MTELQEWLESRAHLKDLLASLVKMDDDALVEWFGPVEKWGDAATIRIEMWMVIQRMRDERHDVQGEG